MLDGNGVSLFGAIVHQVERRRPRGSVKYSVTATPQRGAIRIAPSRRNVVPFSIGFSTA